MQKHVNLVDLVKSFPTNIYLQNLASIQKRTSPVKFAHLAEKSGKCSISNLSTKVPADPCIPMIATAALLETRFEGAMARGIARIFRRRLRQLATTWRHGATRTRPIRLNARPTRASRHCSTSVQVRIGPSDGPVTTGGVAARFLARAMDLYVSNASAGSLAASSHSITSSQAS